MIGFGVAPCLYYMGGVKGSASILAVVEGGYCGHGANSDWRIFLSFRELRTAKATIHTAGKKTNGKTSPESLLPAAIGWISSRKPNTQTEMQIEDADSIHSERRP
jgi:hypothetical protein